MALSGTLLFHLNLQYSAIDRAEHGMVIDRCYRPLLGLLDELPWLRLALEAPGHTLERLAELAPDWIAQLRRYWDEGRVEFVGSGDTQLIGPLVPESVNRWNQLLGQEVYQRLLGRTPRVALVNEMAWSQGLVGSYLDAGYETVVMEWNNPHKHHPSWPSDWRYRMARTESPDGRGIDLAWVDSVAFQKFQRAVHDDLDVDEYVEWVQAQASSEARHVFLYASDAEVFDHRPKRYATEAELGSRKEWKRMRAILEALQASCVSFTLPSELADDPVLRPRRTLCLRSAADPIPVKKQPKYNVTRWALTGRDDLGLNAACFAGARQLERHGGDAEDWRALCRVWASDHRTHLTATRWGALDAARTAFPTPSSASSLEQLLSVPHSTCDDAALLLPAPPGAATALGRPPTRRSVRTARRSTVPQVERAGKRLLLQAGSSCARVSLRRGLAVEGLSFEGRNGVCILGTVPHGALDDIHWAADFYSGHLVAELPAHSRITDLSHVDPQIHRSARSIMLQANIETPLGRVNKRVTLAEGRLELRYDLSDWSERPLGSTRLAFLTFEPSAFEDPVCVTTSCGGPPEVFPVTGEFDHGGAVSALVSARAAFGATDGRLTIDDGRRGVQLSWDPSTCPALPLLTHRVVDGRRFLRLAFSLGEIDETARSASAPPVFELTVRPFEATA